MDDTDNARLLEVFFEVQRGLPRQGPGCEAGTLKALSLCEYLPTEPDILDVGCGPGMQTMVLAKATGGNIVAVDTWEEYIDELRQRAQRASLASRMTIMNADMAALHFEDETFDLIWCEGAAYIMGIRDAIRAWRPLLRNRGYLAFTELVWLDDDPPAEVAEYFGQEYPAMTSIQAINEAICDQGCQPVDDFCLPDSAWWDDYYTPLEAKLRSLKQKYEADEEALGVIAMSEAEIDIRRRFGETYGYHFFVARKVN